MQNIITLVVCFLLSCFLLIKATVSLKKQKNLSHGFSNTLDTLKFFVKKIFSIFCKKFYALPKPTLHKKHRLSMHFFRSLLVLIACFITFFVNLSFIKSSNQPPSPKNTKNVLEEEKTIEAVLESLNGKNELEQHSLIWNNIIENSLFFLPQIVTDSKFSLETTRKEYQEQIMLQLFSCIPSFEEVFQFATSYGDYYGLPNKHNYLTITLIIERDDISKKISTAKQLFATSSELCDLYKEELSIRLFLMSNGYSSKEAYYAGVAAQNVFECRHESMSLGEALFYLTLANDLYNLSLQNNCDSYVLYKQCEIWLKLSRLDRCIHDEETAKFVEKYHLQLLLTSEAYGSLSISPYQSTAYTEPKKYLYKYLGEIFYTLYTSYKIDDAKQLSIDNFVLYQSEIPKGSNEFKKINDYLDILCR